MPYTDGPSIRERRERLHLTEVEVVSRGEHAFDFRWLAAAERGAGVSRHQLDVLARVLEVQTDDIVLATDQRPPYRGLLSFEPEDAPLFGGRDLVVEEILSRLARHAMVGVYGASGSGKSSVVKAGVIARLRLQQNPIWRVLTLRPGVDPLLALARALGSELDREADEDTRIKKARERAEDLFTGKTRLSDYVDAVVHLRAKTGVPERILMFVDQWEEIYTHAPEPLLETTESDHPSKAEKSIAEQPSKPKDKRPTRRSVFLNQLLEVFGQRQHRLIFTMRADFMGRLLEDHLTFFEAVKPGMLPLPRMSHEDLAEAIQKPGQATGLTFDEGLVAAVLKDAGDEPGVLALVEFALTQLWKQRDKERNRLTLQSYHAMAGLRGAIHRHAEAIFAQLLPQDQAAARRALTKLVHVSTLESYTRMRRLLSDMERDEEKVLRHLAEEDSRLVVISYDEQQKSETVEVAHEALIREWKTLRGWVEQDPRFLQWREEVDKRRRRFERNGSKPEDMLQGYDLEEAKSWLLTRGSNVATVPGKGTAPTDAEANNATMTQTLANILLSAHDIPVSICSFIEVSQKRQENLESEREAARVRDKRSIRQLGVAALTLLVLVMGLAILGWFFNEARHKADEQARLALSNETRTLAALAQVALNNKDPDEAVKLGLAAWPRNSTDGRPQLSSAMHVISKTLSEYKLPRLTLRHAAWSTSALMTPDGRILSWSHSSINNDGTLRLWNAETGEPIGKTMKHDDQVVGVLVMPDGRILSWSNDSTLRLWDTKTGEQIGKTMKHDGNVWGALVMQNGRILSWSWDKTLRVWDGKTGEQVSKTAQDVDFIDDALLIPDGHVLLRLRNNTLHLWDPDTGEQIGKTMQHDKSVISALVMPDGHILSWSEDKTLRVWDGKTGEQLGKPMQHDGNVYGALVMPDGRILSWSSDGTLRLWNGKTGKQVGEILQQGSDVLSASLTPDGHILSSSRDNKLRLWDSKTGEQIGKTMQHDSFLNGALVMPDGRILSWSSDGTLQLWDGKTGKQVGEILQQGNGVLRAWLMPDGRVLSSSQDNALRLWDLNIGEQVGSTIESEPVGSALMMPGGRILSWSPGLFPGDNALRIWDIRTGEQVGKTMQHGSNIDGLLVTPGGRILSRSGDNTLRLWDAATGEPIGKIMQHDGIVNGALAMPNGRILSWSEDSTIRLWDAATGEPIGKLMHHDSYVYGALVMPDGRILSWSFDSTLRFWDAATGEPIGKPMQHDDWVVGALVMPDGRILSWSNDKTLRLWDATSGKQIGKSMQHDDRVVGALVMPDGRILSWSSSAFTKNGTLRLWNGETHEIVGKTMQHDGFVYGALVMPDGRILSWSDDKTLRLWDAMSGEQVGKSMLHDDSVGGVLQTPDGHILSWSDKTLRLWDAGTAQLIAKPMDHLSPVSGALVMQDGRLLSWSWDGTLRVWNIAWPKGNLFQVACSLVGDDSLENIVQKYKLSVIAPICDHPEAVPLPDWQSIE